MGNWRFFIDVGGTFTDVVAVSPDGRLRTHKLLSSGTVRGTGSVSRDGRVVTDPARIGDPSDIWLGFTLETAKDDHITRSPNLVTAFDGKTGAFNLTHPLDDSEISYALRSNEEAPVVAIRYLMGLRLTDPVGPIEVRLGTTRATNALLERKGARTAFVTTLGFGDVLKIGYQDRPDLFKLDIRKRDELAEAVVEIDERLDSTGKVLTAPAEQVVRGQLARIKRTGIEALAICLLHAHVNPAHEDFVAAIAESLGFDQISVSSRVARLERIVPRGDTTLVDAYLGSTVRTYAASLRRSMPDARIQLMTSNGGLIEAGSANGKDTILSGPAGGVLGCAYVSRVAGTAADATAAKRLAVAAGSPRDTARDESRVAGTAADATAAKRLAVAAGSPRDTARDESRVAGTAADATAAKRLAVAAGSPRDTAREKSGAGFDRVIGFDMGGTSTDVIRIEAPPNSLEYQHETVKAGVRIVTPMLAVETVAAGGGSICAFDGQKLTVGPHSAGSDPGPACYGRGGPLTVTDVNLILGRVSADHFPFVLDLGVVEEKLAALSDTIFQATGSRISPVALAEGFVQIANGHMAAAIRKVSIVRGYDPAEYALTTFGGAGGQHACAIADALGIPRVLCSPYAGVLSALGIGIAAIKKVAQQSVRLALSDAALSELQKSAAAIATKLVEEVRAESDASTADPATRTTLDVCYSGQSTLLTVQAGSAAAIREEFERQHRRLYGYIHAGREIDIRVLRVEATDASDRGHGFSLTPTASPTARSTNTQSHLMMVGGEARAVALHTRATIDSRTVLEGPAIVVEDTSTIVVDPGWKLQMLPGGEFLLSKNQQSDRHQPASLIDARQSSIDDSPSPIRLELFNNQFAAIAEQMGETLRRTALSTNVKERLDFSCAIFTDSGELVVNAPHIPVHLGGMSQCVRCLIQDADRFEPGDVYITNDPFRGGSHLNDITVITPVFVSDDSALPLTPGRGPGNVASPRHHVSRSPDFFVASRAHHAEIGGIRPGSMPPESKCLAEEGVLIRAFQWMNDGHARQDAMRSLLSAPPYPSRSPDDNMADIAAQVAANQTGVQALLAMIQQHGIQTVRDYMGHIQKAAETKMRTALRRLGDGVRTFDDRLDDGTTIRLRITLRDGTAKFDFSGTDAVHPGNFNANRAIVTSAVMYCLRCLIDEDIPLNAGVLAPVEIVLPDCFLNPMGDPDPQKCPAVAAGNVETSQRIVDSIFGALGMVAASQGTMNNLLMGNARFGYYETICGGAGAGQGFHGADAVHTNMTNTRLTDPETLESRYPVRLRRFQIRSGSGGAGAFRGGCGVIREFEFLETLDVSIISQRRATSPYGVGGGSPGSAGRNLLIRAAAPEIDNRHSHVDNPNVLPSVASLSVQPGDRLIIETPGGGGWGNSPSPLGRGSG